MGEMHLDNPPPWPDTPITQKDGPILMARSACINHFSTQSPASEPAWCRAECWHAGLLSPTFRELRNCASLAHQSSPHPSPLRSLLCVFQRLSSTTGKAQPRCWPGQSFCHSASASL